MRSYEGIFIFPSAAAGSNPEDEKRLEETIRRFGGHLKERFELGCRPLGYAIRKQREGRILHWNFEIEPQQVDELRKALQLDEKILKSMLVKFYPPKAPKERKRKSKPEGTHARKS